MLKRPIYLDYSATTPIDPRVVEKMIPYLSEHYGNPASRSHSLGWTAEEAVETARAEVAKLVHADPKEIVWTSGATESDNLAIKGAAHFYQGKGKHLITLKTEHKAVLDTCRDLERQGFEVSYLDVQENGLLDARQTFKQAITQSGNPLVFKCHFFARQAKGFAHADDLMRRQRTRPKTAFVATAVHLRFEPNSGFAPNIQCADSLWTVGFVR